MPVTGRLEGPLYYIALAVGAVPLLFANRKILAPDSWSIPFGAPINTLTTSSKDPVYVFMASAGGRDLGMALSIITFTLLRDRRAFGILMIAGTIAAIVDAIAVWNHSKASRDIAIQTHGGAAVAMAVLAYFTLVGLRSTKSTKLA